MRHRRFDWFLIGLIGLPFLAAGAAFWAIGLASALKNYRSPLAANPPKPGAALGTHLSDKVVIVLIGALRYDTSQDASVMPTLAGLRDAGAYAVMHSQPPSFSAPGWTAILTGAWPDLNDSQLFDPPDAYSARPDTQDSIFASAQRAGLKTAISGYAWWAQMLTKNNLDASYGALGLDQTADRQVVDAALPWLTENYQLVLIHLDQVDFAGLYQGGPRSPNLEAAAKRADALLKEIASEMDFSRDTLIIVSDHGQIESGSSGGTEAVTLLEPFVAVGAGINPGKYADIQMTDVAPTVAVLLGMNIPASSEGAPLTSMLRLSADQTTQVQSDLAAQQDQLFTDYTQAIGSTAPLASGKAIVSATQAAMGSARLARLASERVWRNVLAVFLAILPAYLLILRREKRAFWLLGSALLYVAVFNFLYAIVDGKTYSLSSVPGEGEYLVYVAVTTLIAWIPAWLLANYGLAGLRVESKQAAGSTLAATWFTLYILSLPVLLSFAINGVLTTWTLPDFQTEFLAFFALIQGIYVSALGLISIGLAAFIARAFRSKNFLTIRR
jgi:hypothetical protein